MWSVTPGNCDAEGGKIAGTGWDTKAQGTEPGMDAEGQGTRAGLEYGRLGETTQTAY